MQRGTICALFLSVSLFYFCFPAAAQPQSIRQTLQDLQAQAEMQLEELTNSINRMKEYNRELEKSVSTLQISNEDLKHNLTQRQKALLTLEQLYSESLTLLTDYSTKLKELEVNLTNSQKLVRTLALVLAAWIGIKLLRILIGLKFPVLDKMLPRIIDILI